MKKPWPPARRLGARAVAVGEHWHSQWHPRLSGPGRDQLCRRALPGCFCWLVVSGPLSLVRRRCTGAAFVLHGFNCLFRFDQGLGLSAEHFERYPTLEIWRRRLKILVDGRLSFGQESPRLVMLVLAPFGHRQE